MSPDDGMNLTYLLIKPHLSWVSGRADLRDSFLCGDVLLRFSHVVEGWVDLGKAVLDPKSAPGKGESEQKLMLSRGLSWSMSGEVSPRQVEGWRPPELCCFCLGAELKAMKDLSPEVGSCGPWKADGFLGALWTLAVALTSLLLLYPSSSRWC